MSLRLEENVTKLLPQRICLPDSLCSGKKGVHVKVSEDYLASLRISLRVSLGKDLDDLRGQVRRRFDAEGQTLHPIVL